MNLDSVQGIKDAYESEISDFLMISFHLRTDNTFLKHSLEGLNGELERHITASQNENKALATEVTSLRHGIDQLKLFAEQQRQQLELHYLRRKNIDQMRLEANFPLHTQSAVEPPYSITMDEYNSMKIRAQMAQEALNTQESKMHELTEYLHRFDNELSGSSTQLLESEEVVSQESKQQQKSSEILESRLVKLLDFCKSIQLENATNKALFNTGELEAFRVRHNTVMAIRAHEPIMLCVSDRALSVEDAAHTPVDPVVIASEPLFVATTEELLEARRCTVELSEQLKLEKSKNDTLSNHLEEYELKHADLLNRLEEAFQLLEEAQRKAEDAHQKEMEMEHVLRDKITEYEDDKGALNIKISHLESSLEQQREEIEAFRLKRSEALKARQMDDKLRCEYSVNALDTDTSVPVRVHILRSEPLFCVTLKEFSELRDANIHMMERLEKMSSTIQDAFSSAAYSQSTKKEVVLQLEDLLQELVDTRQNYEVTRLLLTEKETELENFRTLFVGESEGGKKELIEARAEIEQLQQNLDILFRKMDEVMRTPDITDEANTKTKSNHERIIEAIPVYHETEHEAATQLNTDKNQLPYSRQTISNYPQNNGILEKTQEKIDLMIAERNSKEAELKRVYRDIEQLRDELKVEKKNVVSWEHRARSLEVDLDVVSRRTEDLVNELREKTDQYNQVINDLNDFVRKQSRKDEKELIQRLAACERELFEHREIHKDDIEKYETQVSVLQDQVNRLQCQLEHECIVNNELCNEVSRLQKDLVDAREEVLKKSEEVGILKEEMESMFKVHEEDMQQMDQELEKKNKDVSDALEKLEELTEMLQAAREGEKSALQLRAESDAEVFRLQREIDILNKVHSTVITNSVTNKDGHAAQAVVKKKRSLAGK
ncbi:unnamed protein product [Phytomonas sp. EM1]|nr:unnamed protein product [Phytomonas sp. EM1]|eukprot:CCW60658.1 unnamed protein product [Phytomonas sp. isolate EM1]